MIANWIVLDVATAALPEAGTYLEEGTISAPSNWKDPVKIEEYVREKTAQRIESAALDPDLAYISAIGLMVPNRRGVMVADTAAGIQHEADLIRQLGAILIERAHPTIITYNGLAFDLPMIMRRARYLSVPFPAISLDRYKTPVLDVSEILSDRQRPRWRSLGFYVRRMGWDTLQKPLSGAEEALAPSQGRWEELAESVRHDVTATARLADWLGLIDLLGGAE